ncbi:MAG TPA: hypothetical protein VHC97_22740 [Thermoanaerobaculia bacterium]|jgi:glycogen debranching enzyme|nr:hypothetical protein [Thermoanaerobaculia bacterium]
MGEYSEEQAEKARSKWSSLVPIIREFANADTIEKKKQWVFKYQREALGYLPWDDLSLPKNGDDK